MKKLIVLSYVIMVIAVLPGCSNTAEGAGRDVEKMGQWMQKTF